MKHFYLNKACRKDIRHYTTIILGTCAAAALALSASASGSLQSSPIYTGMQNLLNDLSTMLMVLCPLIGGVAALYFVIRRSMADEQDGKMWTKRMTTAIICGVGGMLISGLISLLTGYFG